MLLFLRSCFLLDEGVWPELRQPRSDTFVLDDGEFGCFTDGGPKRDEAFLGMTKSKGGVCGVSLAEEDPCPIEEGKPRGAEDCYVVVSLVDPRSAGDRGDDDFHRSWFTETAWRRCVAEGSGCVWMVVEGADEGSDVALRDPIKDG